MSKDPYNVQSFMPWWIADYFRDTMSLTTLQHGAYMLLLAAYWVNAGPISADDEELAATVRLPLAEWRKMRPKLERFFETRDGLWHQRRADIELQKARDLKEAQRLRTEAATAARTQRNDQRNGGRDVERDVGDRTPKDRRSDNVTTILKSTPSPTPSPVEAKASTLSRKRERGGGLVDLPSDWKPSEAHRLKASEFSLDCDWHADKMRNWAAAGGQRCKSWDARFYNWLATEKERANGKGSSADRGAESHRNFLDAAFASTLR